MNVKTWIGIQGGIVIKITAPYPEQVSSNKYGSIPFQIRIGFIMAY
jgi:hypothetical protein